MRRTAAVLLFSLAVLAAPAGAATYRITLDKNGFPVGLGPWKTRSGPHLRDGVAALGAASSVTAVRGACKARWDELGLKVTFSSLGGISDFCKDGLVQTAVIRSRRWQTGAGLRVGMRSSRVKQLHHKARFVRGKWVLATQDLFGSKPAPTVSALVRGGRVTALSLFVGQAGD